MGTEDGWVHTIKTVVNTSAFMGTENEWVHTIKTVVNTSAFILSVARADFV